MPTHDQAQPAQPDQLLALNLPPAEQRYLRAIVRTLQHHLPTTLIGIYLFGSAAAGAYEPGISDLDVQAVTRASLDVPRRRAIAADLAHATIPCPARRLEFVLYAHAAVQPARREPPFEINFNTGAGEPDHLTLDPAQEASHWFLLDIALGREVGQALSGPPPASVFAPIPRRWQLEAIADSLIWHHTHEVTSANSVLNACRGWRYSVTSQHGSKRAGAAWARQQPDCPPVVAQAEQRRHDAPLDAGAVRAFISVVMVAVDQALRHEDRQLGGTP